MRGSKAFKAQVFKTTQGRWRWLVQICGTSDVLGAGYAPNQVQARKAAREIQYQNVHRFKDQVLTR